ncbi:MULTISPECIES: helix-turn-helix transcriptional regulator [unclassified Paraburkholderia]|uniref:helix-turn-helix transcriptional regulator n=1 Tax=unclassified Paraburkholderia TaxID=2615204 RepID=UPI00160B5691|nr:MULTISPECIES: helix-turn-helix transcriptional regulator [unclassified Paraburkholderia]MBB5444838.1 HTH-type transcriptional regulator/antitoxin HipB [Paraburkholderia sp. WSM4177]MBB5483770.1 HTH-type transcriptional regulator/antitoxin HipB [Paraburkholderia sp. WSM4180]
MDYAIKTLSQLRPILQGFRKAAGLTQAAMAAHLGVTQQTYAQLEANPATVSVERLFRVLRVLQVDLKLAQSGSTQSVAVEDAAPAPNRSRRAGSGTPVAGAPAEAKRNAKRATRVPLKLGPSAQKLKAVKPAKTTKAASISKKREDW